MRLRLQLTLVFGVFIAVILSAFAVSVYLLTERSLRAGVQERAQVAIAELTTGARSIVQGLQKLPSDSYFQILIVGQQGFIPDSPASLRAGVPYLNNYNLAASLPDSAIQTLLRTGAVSGMVDAEIGRMYVLGDLDRLEYRGQGTVVEAAYFVGVPAGMMAATLDQLARDLVLTVLVAFLAFALGVWILAERVLAPLKRVTAAAALVSGSDLSQRVPVSANQDEIRDLGVAINNMLGRLQESFETQRRFTADASHELRTPVTAIAGHASYLVRRTQPSEAQQESLAVIQRESGRMGKLVNDLLELARADAGFTINLEPMNLIEVVELVKEEVSHLPDKAEVSVSTARPLAEVMGDPERLKQVVLNLVMNAINAGSQHVTVSVAVEGKSVRLEVLDDGSGMPAEAIPHLFDRFYRVDGARSGRGNGSGLGLAIVKWIVQQHGGSVSVESRLGEGSVFTIILPGLDPKKTGEMSAAQRLLSARVPAQRSDGERPLN